jgi:2'-5' RNA ligase
LTQTPDTSPGTVGRDERVRLFCALRLPDDVLDALVAWQHRCLERGRLVPRENLHLTTAFLGRRPASELEVVRAAVRAAAAEARPMRLAVERYRETRSVGMLVCSDADGAAAAHAADLQARLAAAGLYEPEPRPWLPHVTVLRFRERPRLRPELPPVGTFVPSDAAAYLSRLRPGGAQYEVLESAPLGG